MWASITDFNGTCSRARDDRPQTAGLVTRISILYYGRRRTMHLSVVILFHSTHFVFSSFCFRKKNTESSTTTATMDVNQLRHCDLGLKYKHANTGAGKGRARNIRLNAPTEQTTKFASRPNLYVLVLLPHDV